MSVIHARRPARPRSLAALLAVAAATIVLALGSPPAAVAGEIAGDGKPFDAKLQGLDGRKAALSDFRGSPVLLELWASWCLPCQEQSRVIHALRDRLAELGVRVLAVNLGEPRNVVEAFLSEHPMENPILLDRGQVLARLFDVAELPGLVLLDAEGRLVGTRLGLTQRDEVLGLVGEPAASP